jgi:hypothetical protein
MKKQKLIDKNSSKLRKVLTDGKKGWNDVFSIGFGLIRYKIKFYIVAI